jgi:hypothetical protein
MSVSELIEQLQNALAQYGDRRILVDYNDVGEILECRNYNTGEMCLNIKPEDALEVDILEVME